MSLMAQSLIARPPNMGTHARSGYGTSPAPTSAIFVPKGESHRNLYKRRRYVADRDPSPVQPSGTFGCVDIPCPDTLSGELACPLTMAGDRFCRSGDQNAPEEQL
jgi:hypothetical protein